MMSDDSPKKMKYSEEEYLEQIIEILKPIFETYLQPADILPDMPLLDDTLKEDLRLLVDNGLRQQAVSQMIAEVNQYAECREQFVKALRKHDYQRFLDIIDDKHVDPYRQSISDVFAVLLRWMEGDLQFKIVPSNVIIFMKDIISESEYEQLIRKEEREGPIKAFQFFFPLIKNKHSDWAAKFVKAIYNHDERNGPLLVKQIVPELLENRALLSLDGDRSEDFEESMPQDEELNSCDGQQNSQLSDASCTASSTMSPQSDPGVTQVTEVVSEAIGGECHSTTHQVGNLQIVSEESECDSEGFSDEEKQDREGKEKSETGEDEVEDLHMRQYQLELAKNAINGQNTIICAPTGSGKTRVALYIIKNHLEKMPPDERKVIFLARTVPLVTQQHSAFVRHLSDDYRILPMSGENEDSAHLHHLLKNYDIIVLTPQILENHFKMNKINSLSTFSLMVFDECHHTRKGEPYNKLMQRYIKAKLRGKNTKLPQVVGLTASLGVEKATTDEEAKLSILNLCANMDAQSISTVENNKEELLKMVPVPEEKSVPLNEKRNDPGRNEIEKIMMKIEEMLIDENDLDDRSIDRLLMSLPNDRNCQAYGQWAVQLRNRARLAITTEKHETKNAEKEKMARIIFSLAESLIVYNEALEIHDIVHIRDVLDYLTKKFHVCFDHTHLPKENQLLEMFKELKKNLMKLQKNGNNPNPNLTILASTLETLLKEKGEDGRGIIFVRTRATCYALTNWFSTDEVSDMLKRLNATPFTGSGAHEEEGGMTQNDQETIISKFKSGSIKLIVATSVAEEGLDIPECNIILKYNHVGNEISTIQTRGRSRKAGGTSVLLGSSKIRQKEMLNIARGIMMEKAIVTVKSMERKKYQERILNMQQESLMKEDIKEEVRRHLTNRKTGGEFTLVCSRCRQYCTASTDLRTINKTHHVVIGDDFNAKVQIMPDKNQKKPFDGIRITGKIRCRKCHSLWGVMFIYQGVSFPSLGIKYLSVIDADGMPKMYKKWMEVPYTIHEIGLDDFKNVLQSRSQAEESSEEEAGSRAKGGSESQAEGGSGSQSVTGSGSQTGTGSGSQSGTGSGSQSGTGSGSQTGTGSGSQGSQGSTGPGCQVAGGAGQPSYNRMEEDAQNEVDKNVTEEMEKDSQTEKKEIFVRGEPDGGY
ncbi:probable ATP-dependent RNA helicase DHX58 [Gigantopelta aegis]|uniref:probable ATP-dependent RNA helicase DHX58 n=1 Tax=Gigantopelta aegis TaxID=1735272 RepID=UPI001B889874|nr:probable ATP-dependent RNA helicase DHX58 [Gigantopelta aegis]